MNIDSKLSINPQAHAVFTLLSEELQGLTTPDLFEVTPRAWYNGRERGISLEVGMFASRQKLFITFGEVRNSDAIFVDSWYGDTTMNGPSTFVHHDEREKAYARRTTYSYIEHAVQGIKELVINELARCANQA